MLVQTYHVCVFICSDENMNSIFDFTNINELHILVSCFFFKKKTSQGPNSKRSVHTSTSSSVCDHVINLEKNYEETPNVEVVTKAQ